MRTQVLCPRLLNTLFELYFSHTGRVWSIFNMIPFLWLRLSLWLLQQETPNFEDSLLLLKHAFSIAAGSCCIGLLVAAFRCWQNSTIKLNITPCVILARNSPSVMLFALHDGILTAYRAFLVILTPIGTFSWLRMIRPP
jgi:hypothetical protein